MPFRLRSLLPRGLFGRAALILIVPIVTIQLVVSIAFIQRHFEGVTKQLSERVIREVTQLRAAVEAAPDPADAAARAAELAATFDLGVILPAPDAPAGDRADWDDLTANLVTDALRNGLTDVLSVDLSNPDNIVRIDVATRFSVMRVAIPRARLSASNPHQLLVLMVFASILMTLIAYIFLRNQLRPIARLSQVSEAFGRGEVLPYAPRGATEVRAAGAAFLDMRARTLQAIEARTMLLSGISHDLRTPLTRMRLSLSMQGDEPEMKALLSDVAEMERLVEEFLAFARGDALEAPVEADPVELARGIARNAERAGQNLTLAIRDGVQRRVKLRPMAVQRAVENLIGNAVRHGTKARLTLDMDATHLRFVVEDDGEGIPEASRGAAMAPFVRLDDARNRNAGGGGAGLGLSIVADIARSHGGELRLSDSSDLGGLRAELRVMR